MEVVEMLLKSPSIDINLPTEVQITMSFSLCFIENTTVYFV